jgi:hypothetical protein
MHQTANLVPNELSEARSNVLDSFANLEYAVAEVIKVSEHGAVYDGAPLGQKLEVLSAFKPGPKLSKAMAKIITDAAAKAQSLCEIRNDVVHSRMRFVAGHPNIAIYINVREVNQPYPKAHVLTVDQHINLANETKSITDCINKWRLTDKK